jgi:hypothetical protein
VFKEAVGCELVEMVAQRPVLLVELLALVDEVPQLFGLAVAHTRPEGVEEPHGLLLVRALAQGLQLLLVGASDDVHLVCVCCLKERAVVCCVEWWSVE